jgi:acyl-CoA hydrolase
MSINSENKLSFDPDWKEKYSDMVVTPEEAVRHIQPGFRVFIGTGCAQPQRLVSALVARHADLADIEIVHLLTLAMPLMPQRNS